MRFFSSFFCFLALVTSVFGADVLNPPNGDFMIVDGHIICASANQVIGDGSSIGFGFGLSVSTFAEAELIDSYVRSHVSSSYLENNGYRGAFEVRNGQSNIVGGYVILLTQNYSDEDYDNILSAVRQCGYTVRDYPVYIYFDLGEAQISDIEPGDDDLLPGLPPGVGSTDFIRFEYENGEYIWHAGTVNGIDVATGSLIHWCVGFYTTDRQLAYSLFDSLDDFYNSYSWVYYPRPSGYHPHIHHIYEYENGEFLREYWEVGIFESQGPTEDHAAYMQFRYDFLMSQGHFYDVSCPDFDSIYTPNPANPYSDNLSARSSLAGVQLAQASASDGGTSVELPQGVVFTQSTNGSLDAVSGDFTGESTVNSTAEASTSGTTVNITNNTEINTNLQLGDAPAADEYENDEELEEKEVSELERREDPYFEYIIEDSDGYSLNRQKIWDEVDEKINDIFPINKIKQVLSTLNSTGSLQPLTVNFANPILQCVHSFTIDFPTYASFPFVVIIRTMASFFIVFETFMMCLHLFA